MGCRQDKAVAAPAAARADVNTQTTQAANPTRESRLSSRPHGAPWELLNACKMFKDISTGSLLERCGGREERTTELPRDCLARKKQLGETLSPCPSLTPFLPFFLYIWTIAKGCQKM